VACFFLVMFVDNVVFPEYKIFALRGRMKLFKVYEVAAINIKLTLYFYIFRSYLD
jgi:hypothetical protein